MNFINLAFNFNLLKIILSIAFFLITFCCKAQLYLVPLENNTQIVDFLTQNNRPQLPSFNRNAIVCPTQILSLPFFDDFSKIDSFYPKCSHWQDNQAFVNANYAYLPPTVGEIGRAHV